MTWLKRILYWSAGLFFVALLIFLLLAPAVINSGPFKERIRSGLTSITGVELDFDEIVLVYYPRMQLSLRKSTLSHELIDGVIEELTLAPRLLSLARGNLQGTNIGIVSPRFRLALKEGGDDSGNEGSSGIEELNQAFSTIFSPLLKAHGISLFLEDGSLLVSRDESAVISLDHLRVDITSPADALRIELQSVSDLWDRLGLNLSIAADHSGVKGSAGLAGLDLQTILDRFTKMDPEKVPEMTLSLKLGFDAADGHSSFSVSDMMVEETDGVLKAAMSLGSDPPEAALVIEGKELDVREVGGIALKMAGENRIVKGIFGFLREGEVPRVSFETKGRTVSELFRFSHMIINGDLRNGSLSVPARTADLVNVNGGVRIEKGHIQGLNVDAELEHIKDFRFPYPFMLNADHVLFNFNKLELAGLEGHLGNSSLAGGEGTIDVKKKSLHVRSGNLSLRLKEIHAWLSGAGVLESLIRPFDNLDGVLDLSVHNLTGPLARPKEWGFRLSGNVDNIETDTSFLPERLFIEKGSFLMDRNDIEFLHLQTGSMDALFNVSGILRNYAEGDLDVNVSMSGTSGPKAIAYGIQRAGLPQDATPLAPMRLTDGRLTMKEDVLDFAGIIEVRNRVKIIADLSRRDDEIELKRLSLIDDESNASFSGSKGADKYSLAFDGYLTADTVNSLVSDNRYFRGWIRGDLNMSSIENDLSRSTLNGVLEGQDILVPYPSSQPIEFRDFSLEAYGDRLKAKAGGLAWNEQGFSMDGELTFSPAKVSLFSDIHIDGLRWKDITGGMKDMGKNKEDPPKAGPELEAEIKVAAGYFSYEDYELMPANATLTYKESVLNVDVTDTELCRIPLSGSFEKKGEVISLELIPEADARDLHVTLACLLNEEKHLSGTYDFNGVIRASGTVESLKTSLNGDFQLIASNGRIYKMTVLSKILALLNVTEIYRGVLPTDILKKGLPYRSLTVMGEMKDSKIVLHEVVLDGETLNLYAEGEMNILDRESDIDVVVSPFKTTDTIIKMIPVLRDITGGTLITIPMKVTGDITDPKITYLPAEAIGTRLLDVMKNTIEAPFKILEPVFPKSEK